MGPVSHNENLTIEQDLRVLLYSGAIEVIFNPLIIEFSLRCLTSNASNSMI